MVFLKMTSDPTVETSPHFFWSYTELWARDFLIEYLYLFSQILYYFCQRVLTSTCARPSARLYVRALRRKFLYRFDRNLLFLSYGASFIPFPGFALYRRVYMLVLSYLIYSYFYCALVLPQKLTAQLPCPAFQ